MVNSTDISALQFETTLPKPGTPLMQSIISLYHNVNMILLLVGAYVFIVLISSILGQTRKKSDFMYKVSNFAAEITWVGLPSWILIAIGGPSIYLIFSMDEVQKPTVTFRAIGHQWYWNYEIAKESTFLDGTNNPNYLQDLNFESRMLSKESTDKFTYRLDVDNVLLLPILTDIRLIVTAVDVIHSWSVPAFGVKIDACPGRVHQTSLYISEPGTYYGQCSELCGQNHGFMPIVVSAVSVQDFFCFVYSNNSVNPEELKFQKVDFSSISLNKKVFINQELKVKSQWDSLIKTVILSLSGIFIISLVYLWIPKKNLSLVAPWDNSTSHLLNPMSDPIILLRRSDLERRSANVGSIPEENSGEP